MGRHWKYFLLLLWFSYLLVSGVLLFTSGYLLNREVQPQKSTCTPFTQVACNESAHNSYTSNKLTQAVPECSPEVKFLTRMQSYNDLKICVATKARVVLIVIDALRFDFAYYFDNILDSELLPYQNKLSVINDLITKHPNQSRLFKFIADPPTTTMQRLKGLTTGSLPTFIDIGSNFATPEINEDNFLDQLTVQNRSIVFMGDDTWTGLYPQRFVREYSYPSFNVWDLDTVDTGIRKHLLPELAKSDWSLLIAHFLGVDHCGHRYGPQHPEMSRKLLEMNGVLQDVVNTIDNDTMLFVIGDHGMTDGGNHGGDSDAELTAAMFVYSHGPLASPDPTVRSDIVNQVDMIPTISAILGLPIPFSNLGSTILDSLPSSGNLLQDSQLSLQTVWNNVQQMTLYIDEYSRNTNQFPQDKVSELWNLYTALQKSLPDFITPDNATEFIRDAKAYMQHVREMCEEVWVKFDPFSISRGLLLTSFSGFFYVLLAEGLPGYKLRELMNGSLLVVAYCSMGLAALVSLLSYHLNLVESAQSTVYFSTGLVSIVIMVVVVTHNWDAITMNWYDHSKLGNWSSIGGRLLVMLSLCGMFSNSYVVEEGTMLSYLLLTMVWLLVYSHGGGGKGKAWWKSKLRLVGVAVLLSMIVRLSHYYWGCREEQVDCRGLVPTGTDSFATIVAFALLVTMARIWLRSCGNLVGFSPLVTLARYGPTVGVVCCGGWWVLQELPSDMRARIVQPWQLQFLSWVFYAITITTLLTLAIQPLCTFSVPGYNETAYGQGNAIPQLFHRVKGLMQGGGMKQEEPVVYGLATAYSAAFVILGLSVCLLESLLLGHILAPAAVLTFAAAITTAALSTLLRQDDALLTAQLFNVPWTSVILWGFLSSYFFYGTGHQATFPSLQWGAAMVGTGGNFPNHLVPALLVGINTFASQILFGLTLPLLLIAPFTLHVMFPNLTPLNRGPDTKQGELFLFEKEDLLYHGLFGLINKYILYYSIRIFSCMLAATIHCRHLMVWKIFAPKLIFEIVGLFVTLSCTLVSYLLVVRITGQVETLIRRLEKQQR